MERYRCRECSEPYARSDALREHLTEAHGITDPEDQSAAIETFDQEGPEE